MDDNDKYINLLKQKKITLFFKRFFDIIISFLGIMFLFPLFIFVYLLIIFTSKGGGLYKQERVGKNFKIFKILKFRTMTLNADKKGLLISTSDDNRITKVGKILRKTKIDELPQLFNVLVGDMSFVGPRPEVKKYVDMYNNKQKNILLIKPGITENASIEFKNENDILRDSNNPEKTYIENIMPIKINYGLQYIENFSLFNDFKIILKTIFSIIV